jgi:hypothetical protein
MQESGKNALSENDFYVHGLIGTEGQVVAAEAELDRVTQRSAANDFHLGPVAESHFQQPTANFGIAAHGKNGPLTANAELVEGAGFRRLTVIASRKFATFLHNPHS